MEDAATQESPGDMEGFQDPRWITLRPSRLGMAFLALGTLLAGIALAASRPSLALPWWIAWIAIVIAVAVVEARRIALKVKGAPRAFYLFEFGSPERESTPQLGVRLLQGDSRVATEGAVVPGSFVTPVFTAIAYRLAGDAKWRPARILPLWKDSLDAEAFRQTRVRLRWH